MSVQVIATILVVGSALTPLLPVLAEDRSAENTRAQSDSPEEPTPDEGEQESDEEEQSAEEPAEHERADHAPDALHDAILDRLLRGSS